MRRKVYKILETKNGEDELLKPAAVSKSSAELGSLSDENLMLLVQEGRSQAYDILVSRYRNRLYTYICRLLNDRDEAEELAQETFVRAFLNADKYCTVARFSTWLYTIATNLARNRMRDLKRRHTYVSLWTEQDSESDGKWLDIKDDSGAPDESIERQDIVAAVQEAIEKIPAKYRPAFVLREIDEMSYEEISAITGTKLGTVRSRINRARSYFKKHMTPFVKGRRSRG